jgi:hypothetical protein
MKLTANITLDELTKSQISERKGIPNNPNPTQIENLKALAVNILQPVRSHFDKPLIISSGFRCAQLCVEIGSSVNSQHVADDKAAAADGQDGDWHFDDGDYTILLMVSETLKDGKLEINQHKVDFIQNRCVIFDTKQEHRALASKYATLPRCTVAIKTKIKNGNN